MSGLEKIEKLNKFTSANKANCNILSYFSLFKKGRKKVFEKQCFGITKFDIKFGPQNFKAKYLYFGHLSAMPTFPANALFHFIGAVIPRPLNRKGSLPTVSMIQFRICLLVFLL